MSGFYQFREIALVWMLVFATMVVLVQAIACLTVFWRRTQHAPMRADLLLEGAVLLYSVMLFRIPGYVMHAVQAGLLVPSPDVVWRSLAVPVFGVMAVYFFVRLRRHGVWPVLAASLWMLPWPEQWSGAHLPWVYMGVLTVFFVRGVDRIVSNHTAFGEELSYLSSKYAIDRLPSGLLFYDRFGRVVLSNITMQRVAIQLTGQSLHTTENFWRQPERDALRDDVSIMHLSGTRVYRLPDQTVWQFSETPLIIGENHYTQLIASDVSELWRLNTTLTAQNALLAEKRMELRDTLANLERLLEVQERLRLRSFLHDHMAQAITMLVRTIGRKEKLDAAVLAPLMEDLLHASYGDKPPREWHSGVRDLCTVFSRIDVCLDVCGDPPPTGAATDACLDMLREAATNAVRHGLATQIDARGHQQGDWYRLTIRDNGSGNQHVLEGGGLTGIRRKAERLGGRLQVHAGKSWVLEIDLPRGGDKEHDQGFDSG